MTDLADAMTVVLELARSVATSQAQKDACDIVEDFIVNQLGDDE